MTQTTPAPAAEADGAPPHPPLRRTRRRKVVAGVCGGLGRHYDMDPVIFRVVIGVLAVTGGLGLLFYGFAWLLVTADGDDENEARRLVSGRVDGASLIALLMALVGCGLFLSMLGNSNTVSFSLLLIIAVSGAAVWSQRRRLTDGHEAVAAAATAHTAAEAPPETKAPPPPESPSWWREPIVKDGTSGPVPLGYLWGPEDGAGVEDAILRRPARSAAPAATGARGPRSLGGPVFLLALVAGGLGTGLSWGARPLGTALQTGLVSALVVFALALVVSAFRGRTGAGTIVMTVLTSVLLAGASLIPRQIGTEWVRTDWRPAATAELRPHYELGTGVGTLDLSRLDVPAKGTARTSAEVGAGRLHVIVPRDATVRVNAQVGFGDLRLPTEAADDVDIAPDVEAVRTIAPPRGTAPAGTLDLVLEVSVGQVEVTRATS
ncbi:PspC domain-containing protein [Streptomyces sp. NPDC015131]|uniref:PspC domain-containing protein n=1 Tax=Streptomyces sp. NPDC015131 TaxID=3364941 RepID=UPI0036F66C4D